MVVLLSAFLTLSDTVAHQEVPVDTVHSERTDTLREVEVRGRKRVTVLDGWDAAMKANAQPGVPSLGDVLNKYAPNATDYVLHPFGFKQRKQNRQRKRRARILQEYDRVKSFEQLLDEAVRRQQEEDERNRK